MISMVAMAAKNKAFLLGRWIMITALAAGGTAAWAGTGPGACEPKGGGGGGQPDPLTIYNARAELADGELYLLRGEIVMIPLPDGAARRSQPYLRVDFDAHPWLASRKRAERPFYPIEGPVRKWRALEGTYVELTVLAKVEIRKATSGELVSVITLKPVAELNP